MKTFIVAAFLILAISLAGCDMGSENWDDEPIIPGPDYREFVQGKENLKYTATYEISSQDMGYTMTQYYGGEDKVRTDNLYQGQEARVYILNDEIFSCGQRPDGWVCVKMESESVEQYAKTFDDVTENPDKYSIRYTGTMALAGTEAHCYKIKLPQLLGMKVEQCFSQEGVPLYMKMGSLMETKAISYTPGVSVEDFSLPAEPVPMEELSES